MHAGDLILTPGGCWHDHGHVREGPVIWLNSLDLPLLVYLEGSYAVEAPLQKPRNRPDASEVEYRAAGLAPVRRRDRPAPAAYPMMRFPWERTEAALRRLAEHCSNEPVELDCINPETGRELPADDGVYRHDASTQRSTSTTAPICEHCVSCHQRKGKLGDQWRHACVGTEGYVLSTGIHRD